MSNITNPKKETISKVLNFIRDKSPVTPTQISAEGIDFRSVNASIDFLEDLGHIRTITNGSTKLIEVVKNGKNTK